MGARFERPWLLAIALLITPAVAAAAPPDDASVEFRWDAPSECPLESEVERLLGGPVANQGNRRLAAIARVRRESDGSWDLKLWTITQDATRQRSMSGEDCAVLAAARAARRTRRRQARYLFAWPEVHAGLRYEQMLLLDGRGRRMLATGPTPIVAAPDTLAPGAGPLHLPVPDLLVFSGHEWDAEARRELVIPRDTSCEGLEGAAALTTHERRKFECGSFGPARRTSIGGGGNSGSVGYPGELSF